MGDKKIWTSQNFLNPIQNCIHISKIQILTLQMFTGVYRMIKWLFSNIWREPCNIYRLQGNPCRYCRKNLNHPVNPCKYLQCETVFILSDLKIFFQRSYLTHYFLIKDNIMSLKKTRILFWSCTHHSTNFSPSQNLRQDSLLCPFCGMKSWYFPFLFEKPIFTGYLFKPNSKWLINRHKTNPLCGK